MAGDTPAVENDTSADAEAPAESLLDDAAPAPAEADAKPDSEAAKPADDAKPEGDKPPASLLDDDEDGEKPSDAESPAPDKEGGEPEAYQSFTLPDGMSLDDTALAAATPILKKFAPKQEDAQELVSLYADLTKQTLDGVAAQQAADHRNLVSEWTKATKSDPEFGGERLKESQGLVKQAIAKFGGTPDQQAQLTSMMKEWGIGNNPLLFGLLVRAAAATSQDTLETGDSAASPHAGKAPWERMYPNMKE